MDRDIKATVYKIAGSIPAGNFIQFPKSSSQSLNLTGRYIYLLLRPLACKYFVIHLELVTSEGLLVRLSFSNLFKEFKSSSTWLQLPFVTSEVNDKLPHLNGNDKWTILCMDLQCILKEFLHSSYSHLKGIKLCGNLLVRNIFTSDIRYLPNVMEQFGAAKLPKEMSFHVPRGSNFNDLYNFITFPTAHTDRGNVKESRVVNHSKKHHVICEPVGVENIKPEGIDNVIVKHPNRAVNGQAEVQGRRQSPTSGAVDDRDGKQGGSVEKRASYHVKNSKVVKDTQWPDPIMSLDRVIGFGGSNMDHVIFTKDCKEIVFPSHSLIVAMEIGDTRRQKMFMGHTDKVCSISFNSDNSLLASGQSGKCGVVRVWNYVTRACLAVVTLPSSSVSLLSFSHSGNVLCSVGKEVTSGGRNKIILWNTSLIRDPAGEVETLATGHTDADISCIKMAQFDDTRMVSCGWDNIRLWRLRSRTLKFCPVNLEEHHQMHFTDICFEAGYHDNGDITDRFIYACTKSGHMFEIHYRNIYVSRVWQLLPSNPTATPINAMVIHEAFCVTGSEDGLLRVWPLDFSNVILEIEHEGPVTAVDISMDGMKILAGTKSGSIGVLDATTKEYSTVMRSHVGLIQCVDMTTEHLISCSSDGTIRVWNVLLMNQLYDFRVEGEIPCCVQCHPKQNIFACGFKSGRVQLFDMSSSLAEYRHHRGIISGLQFTSTGSRLYSSSCDSTLAMYNVGSHKLLKLLGNTVVMGTVSAPGTISLDHNDTKLAVVGPLAHTITIMDPDNMNELVRLDITATPIPHSATPTVDVIVALKFSPPMMRHLVVITTTGSVLKFDTTSGRLLFEYPQVHTPRCSTMAISGCGNYLVTAGNKTLRVWPYSLQPGSKHQVFIGHSDTITQALFNNTSSKLITVGEALFCWTVQPLPIFPATPHDWRTELAHPRHTPPLPSTYKPVTAHTTSFLTPCGKGDHMSSNVNEESDVSSSSDHVSSSDDDSHTNDIIIDHDSGGSDSLSTVQEEGDNKSSQSLLPCQQPASLRYYNCQPPEAAIAELQYLAPQKQAGIKLRSVLGYNGRGRRNVVWQPITGTLVYSCGSVVVEENLSTGEQNYLIGHREEVSTIALSNDGQHLASACGGHGNHKGEIKIWQVKSYKCKKTLLFHTHQITCLTYSRDDRFLISIGDHQENMLALWSTENYVLLAATTTSSGLILDVSWDPHIAYECVSCGCGPSLCFWLLEETSKDHVTLNVHEAEVPATIKNGGKTEFTSLCYSTESRLFVGSNSGHITLWDTRNNICIMYWRCGTSEVMCVACELHHGNTLSVGLSNNQLQLWKLTTPPNSDQLPIATMELSLQLDSSPTGSVFDSDLQLGVVGTTAGTVWYVNWHDNSMVRLLGGHGNKVTGVLSLSCDSKQYLATCSHDGTLRVWSCDTLQETICLKALNKMCTCISVCPVAMETIIGSKQQGQEDEGVVGQCAVGYEDGMLRVFELTEKKMIVKWQPHKRAVNNLSYSMTGNVLLSGCKDGQVAISNPHTGVILHMIGEHKGIPITDLSVAKGPPQSPNMDGRELWLVASGDRRVSIWSSDWSRMSCQLMDWLTFPGPPCAPDGTMLHRGKKCQFHLLPPSLARFNPNDSDMIIYTGYGLQCCIHVYSIPQRQLLCTIALNHWPTSMSIAPQGHLIAVGCKERLLTIVDYEEGSFQDYPGGHSDTVHRVEFSDDGNTLYSLCDNTVFLWTVLI